MLKFYFIFSLMCITPSLFAAGPDKTKPAVDAARPPASSVPAEPAATKTPSAVTAVTEAAVRQGVLACARRIEQVVKALNTNAKSGTFFFPAAKQPDQGLFSLSMEVTAPDKPSLYASVSFAPNAFGGCDAVYDAVEYLPQSCADAQKKSFAQSSIPPILKEIGVLNAGAVKVFFMPADTGCVVMKKEVLN